MWFMNVLEFIARIGQMLNKCRIFAITLQNDYGTSKKNHSRRV